MSTNRVNQFSLITEPVSSAPTVLKNGGEPSVEMGGTAQDVTTASM
jgi:hypothetical protein